MRDQRRNLAKQTRRRRRVILATMVMACSPALADGPRLNHVGGLPPLPLQSTANPKNVRSNPFCDPVFDTQVSEVQLASGSSGSSIRLKPIGAAIGLQPIESSEPRKVEQSVITIEPVGSSSVRSNPLIESAHHTNRQLVDTDVVDQAAPAIPRFEPDAAQPPFGDARPTTGRSSIILLAPAAKSLALDIVPEPPTPATAIDLDPRATAPTFEPVDSTEPVLSFEQVPASQSVEMEAALPSMATAFSEQKNEEAVFFSLSDRPADCSDEQHPSTTSEQEPEEPDEADALAEGGETDGQDDVERYAALDAPIRLGVDAPVHLEIVQPIVLDASEFASLAPIDSVMGADDAAPIAIYQDAPVVLGPVESPEATLHAKRYRPPVAVKPVPLAVERPTPASDSVDQSAVQSVPALNLDGLSQAAGGSIKLTALYLSRAQVRSLTVAGEVRGVKVADKSICQAFAAGPNQLKLIGTGNGVTRLVVWADGNAENEPTRMRAFEIHVNDAVDTGGEDVSSKAELLNQSIQKAFPTCSVKVQPHRGQLLVTGRCDTEKSATQIIRMVRKACLIPVQDDLVVR